MTSSSRPEPNPGATRPRRRPRARLTRPGVPRHAPPSTRQLVARNPALRIGLLVFGVLVVVALAVDVLRRLHALPPAPEPVPPDPGAFVLGLDDRVYADPGGRFVVTIPAPWRVRTGARVEPDDVVLVGPNRIEFAVRVAQLDHRSFGRLMADVYARQDYWGIDMRIETFEDAGGRPVVRRRIRLIEHDILAYDFLEDAWGHHLRFRVPRGELDRYEPLFRELFEAYRALDPDAAPPADAGRASGRARQPLARSPAKSLR